MIWIIVAGLGVLLVIAIMIYSMPAEGSNKSKKKAVKPSVPVVNPDDKDWKEIAKRWEVKNNALLAEVEKLKIEEKKWLKEIEGQKTQYKDIVDKLALEKSWREKEQGNIEKVKVHEKELKDQIIRTEKDLEKEHSVRMSLERQVQELKIKCDAVTEEKRVASTNAASLTTTVNQLQAELKDLRKQNEELKRKREDVSWVAKSEFDELQQKYLELKKQNGN